MKLLHSMPPFNFCGIDEIPYGDCKVVVLPVPYDSTAFYGAGARRGPSAIIDASRNMELYDIGLGFEPAGFGIHTLPELEPSMAGPLETIERVREAVFEILEDKKFPVILGGEHSITFGAAKAFKGRKISFLQLDAHSDLRNEFEGTGYGHACVMRRISERFKTVGVGIRSMCTEEAEFIKEQNLPVFYGNKFKNSDVISKLGDEVYITLDVDVFDPAIMPATGTPEPDGLNWTEVTSLLQEVAKKKNIVGFDVVELAPIPGQSASDFLAAKLAYTLIGHIGKSKGWKTRKI
ncbi:MAG: agmatinase [Candidatus Micrarchaeota archaeon]|nr:agmatinase [Candidatus Micrarchaeota archaeon]